MRFRLRFSLRAFLLSMFLVALATAWFAAYFLQKYRAEAVFVARLERMGGTVHRERREPQWFWQMFGANVAHRADVLILFEANIGDEELAEIGKLSALQGLYLQNNNVTYDGVRHIRGLTKLVALGLRGLPISAPPIDNMEHLIELDLAFTDVTRLDVRTLPMLESLTLRATRFNDAALAALPPMPALRTLDVSGDRNRRMKITDEGVAELTPDKFPMLTRIYLYETEISSAGEKGLRERFPGIAVNYKSQ
jgi:hypothetical protein